MRLPAPWAVETGAAPQVVAETRKEEGGHLRQEETDFGAKAGQSCRQPLHAAADGLDAAAGVG